MKLLIVSDAWHPQVNGVVRTLEETARALAAMGHEVKITGPEKGFWTFPAPSYPEIKLEFFADKRLRALVGEFQPDYVHISTEGPLGMAMRHVCMQQKRPYSTAYHTCFPEYLEKRVPAPFRKMINLITYQWIKRLHVPSCAVMVSTPSIEAVLRQHRISRIRRWSRGVNTAIFKPYGKDVPAYRNLPRPISLYVGRVAVEKNIEAFLALDLPGSKVIIGDGPHEAEFRARFPAVHFLGKKSGEELARHFAAADVFVFPSKTDTFGLVLLEAVACGLPVAAYPVQGPRDVFADTAKTSAFAVLDDDLREAVLKALALKPDADACHRYVEENFSWAHCTQQFLDNLQAPTPYTLKRIKRFERALDFLHGLALRIRTLPKFYPNLYRAATLLIAPFLPLFLQLRASQGKEDRARMAERFGHASRARPPGKLIWCHAVSVGESLSVLPLLTRLLALPEAPSILLTTGTRSAATILAKRLPPAVIHQYIPVDTMPAMSRFMQHWQPDMAMLVESELWPNMIGRIRARKALLERTRQAEGRAMPAILLNARISRASAQNWMNFASLWIRALLSAFDLVLAQSDGDAARFRALGAYQAHYAGNLKAAAEPLPHDETALAVLKAAIGGRPLWVMASTHEGEDEMAARVHKKLQAEFPGLLTILVPRHPARAGKILENLAQMKLSALRRSEGKLPQADTAIYLADTFGELGLFYRLAKQVVIAGSFGKTGGHNPLEAAQFGCAIFFGPDMRHFAELAEDMLRAGAAQQVKDEAALAAALRALLSDAPAGEAQGAKALAFATKEKQVLDKIMAELRPFLHQALHDQP